MSTIDQILYLAPSGGDGDIRQAAASIRDRIESERWQQRLEPWLRSGSPQGRGYMHFGSQAALIRWRSDVTSPHGWQYALVLIGQPAVLTGSYALELPVLSAKLPILPNGGRLRPTTKTEPGPCYRAIEAEARSQKAIDLLIPLLARVLAGERSVTMPWTGPSLPEAVMWALTSILSMLGDSRPVSFLTYMSGRAVTAPGRFVSFRPGAASLPPDPGFETVARNLATRFADNPDGLRLTLLNQGVLASADHGDRLGRLLDLVPP
ncbi:MAG: hypothetical protein ACRDNF_11710, partial [Streptosporangiaceae bacterium]